MNNHFKCHFRNHISNTLRQTERRCVMCFMCIVQNQVTGTERINVSCSHIICMIGQRVVLSVSLKCFLMNNHSVLPD